MFSNCRKWLCTSLSSFALSKATVMPKGTKNNKSMILRQISFQTGEGESEKLSALGRNYPTSRRRLGRNYPPLYLPPVNGKHREGQKYKRKHLQDADHATISKSVSYTAIFLNIPVKNSHFHRELRQEGGDFLSDGNRPVSSPRAADGDSHCFLTRGTVLFNKKLQ